MKEKFEDVPSVEDTAREIAEILERTDSQLVISGKGDLVLQGLVHDARLGDFSDRVFREVEERKDGDYTVTLYEPLGSDLISNEQRKGS